MGSGRWPRSRVRRPRRPAGPSAQAPVGPVPRHGRARAGDHRDRHGARGARRRRRRRQPRPRRTARRSSATPRPSCARLSPCLGLRAEAPTIEGCCPPARADPAQSRRGLRGLRPARRLQAARRRPRDRRAGPRRSATSSPCSRSTGCCPPAHVRGPRPDRRGLPLLRRPVLPEPAGAAALARAHAGAPRGRRGDAHHNRDALPGHQPAGDRLLAADRTRRRSATSRSSPLQPQVLMVVIITSTGGVSKRVITFELAGRPRPRRLGGLLPQRARGRHGPRRAHAAFAARRSDAGDDRARVPRRARARLHRARPKPPRTRSTSTAPRGCCRGPPPRPLQINELMDMLERRVSLLGVLSRRARPARRLRPHRAPRTPRPRCSRCRWSPRTTGCRSATSAPSR